MSLNALGSSSLALKAASSAVAGSVYSYGSGAYAGIERSDYDVILGVCGPLVAGTIDIPLSTSDVSSAALAGRCIVEAWLNNTATGAGTTTVGAKYAGLVIYAAGPPATATLRISAFTEAGAIEATFVGTLAYRVYIPRS